jgi:hypothetical protein
VPTPVPKEHHPDVVAGLLHEAITQARRVPVAEGVSDDSYRAAGRPDRAPRPGRPLAYLAPGLSRAG